MRIAPRVDSDLMARSPVLVWRNATRIRLITAFRGAHGAPEDALIPGEPLICDGIELPLKHRKRRIDLEARGLIKGAPVIYGCSSLSFDLRLTTTPVGAPECGMLNAGAPRLAQKYMLPSFAAGG